MSLLRAFTYLLISFYFISPRIVKSVDLDFLDELTYCLELESKDKCDYIIAEIENTQLDQYEKGNFKCQTSLLGLQTELIKSIYFDQTNDRFKGFTIPFVIKNC